MPCSLGSGCHRWESLILEPQENYTFRILVCRINLGKILIFLYSPIGHQLILGKFLFHPAFSIFGRSLNLLCRHPARLGDFAPAIALPTQRSQSTSWFPGNAQKGRKGKGLIQKGTRTLPLGLGGNFLGRVLRPISFFYGRREDSARTILSATLTAWGAEPCSGCSKMGR